MEIIEGVMLIEDVSSPSLVTGLLMIAMVISLPIYVIIEKHIPRGDFGGLIKFFICVVYIGWAALIIILLVDPVGQTTSFVTHRYRVQISSETDMDELLEKYSVTFTDKKDECIITEKEQK